MQGWLPEGNDWPGRHNQPLGPEAGSPEWRNDRMGGYHAWDEIVACAAHGTPLEQILKDIDTVRYQPRRLWESSRIAMRLVGA